MAVLNGGVFPDTHIDLSFSIFIVLKVYFSPANAGKPSATILGPTPLFRNGFEAFFMHALSDLHFCLYGALQPPRVVTMALCSRACVPDEHCGFLVTLRAP